MQPPLKAIIMAAGKGTRLKSDTPKVLHKLFEKPLLARVLETLQTLEPAEVAVILGHGRDQVQTVLDGLVFGFPMYTVVQEPQLGTGHAVLQVVEQLPQWQTSGSTTTNVIILSGDVPLLTPDSLKALVETHRSSGNTLTVLAATVENPFGYGRVLTAEGLERITGIVEEKDATDAQRAIRTVNTGIYCLQWETLSPLLHLLSSSNAQNEFYLTDLIALAVANGHTVGVAHLRDADEVLGVNSRADLARCHELLNQRTQTRLMNEGVTILQPSSTFVAPEIQIGADTVLMPGCVLQGTITIGKRCTIGPHTTMSNTVTIADDVKVIQSSVRDAQIGAFTTIGPFAQLRDGVDIGHHVLIGNFVELKKTRIDHHTNVSHLAYIGDAELGSDVNIGAGTITANYDPIREIKERTLIENDVKVGSNSVLIAPLTIGEGASVAAGSVITDSVLPGSLAIARQRQTVIPDWVKRTKAKHLETLAAKKP